MDYKHFIYDTITEFTGQNNTLSISVTLIDFVDDLETGLFLSQVIYWADRTKRSDGYFYKTDDEWNQEIKLSKYSVRKARKKLEEMSLLETVVKKANGNPTVHYKFDKDKFTQLFISFLRNRKNESSESQNGTFENKQSLTEITTETTTKNTTKNISKVKPSKIKYAESVSMTEDEYKKLVEQHGESSVKEMITVLDNYKGAHGKRYKSDYKAILTWVVDRVKGKGGGQSGPNARNFTQTSRTGTNYEIEPPPIDWDQR